MKKEDIIKNVAYCGLICPLDSCYENCDGCRVGPGCGDTDCIHKKCCNEKALEGCWQCGNFPCNMGYFSSEKESRGQFVACIKYIKKTGLEQYVGTIMENSKNGIKYGMCGDYANKDEDEVTALLDGK